MTGIQGRILIVDDEAFQREVLQRALRARGHEVAEAADGARALSLLAGWRCDLVLSDLRMPGEPDGMGLLRRLREDRPDTDILLMTGAPELESALEAMRSGAWDYLPKPVDLSVLCASIERCLQHRRALEGGPDARSLREAVFLLRRRLNALEGMRSVLSRHFPQEVSDRALQDPGESAEKHELSVLFADLRGFTRYCESRDPQEVLETLNGLFSRISPLVASRRGIVDKYTGDGLMAVFGAPREDSRHAEEAVLCAIEILREAGLWNAERRERGLEPLSIGIGIDSGEAVAGTVGGRERSDYTVIGRVVNLACRLQAHAAAGEILLGPSTAAAVSSRIPLRSRGLCQPRGFSSPIAVFEPAPAGLDSAPRTPEQGEVPPRELGRQAQALR